MARLIGTLQLDAGSVEDQHISSGTKIDADKAQHLYRAWTNFDIAIGATPVAREEIVHVCEVAGTIRQFAALCNETGSPTQRLTKRSWMARCRARQWRSVTCSQLLLRCQPRQGCKGRLRGSPSKRTGLPDGRQHVFQ